MRIEHLTLWTDDVERLAAFYHRYFSATARQDGHALLDGPRRTGDGCYESVVLDPDGNRVEIVT